VRRRVVFVITRYRTYDRRMYEALAAAFDLHVIWVSPAPDDEPVPAALAMRWETIDADPAILRPTDLRRNVRLLRRLLAAGRGADLIVASTSDSWKARLVYAAAAVLGVPIAMRKEKWRDKTTRDESAYWRVQRQLTDYMERRADGMLVGGSKSADYLIAHGVPAAKIRPFRYLHPDLAERPLDRELIEGLRGRAGGRTTFLFLGRAIHRKGLVPLVRAFRAVLDAGRDATLLVVGGPIAADTGRGKVSTEYYSEARRLAGGDDRIAFLGHVEPGSVHNYYAAADVFVHPHVAVDDGEDVHEGWGQVITEAACMSRPIITTDRVASAFDIVVPGQTGFLLHADRLEAELPQAIAAFVDQPGLAARLGASARRRFEEFVDPGLNVRALQSVIDEQAR
jgi:glycosyltransferase involved in cell wall biosynthesis